jgi:putative heme-binding domain-containing protein
MDALAALHSGAVKTEVLEQLVELYRESVSPTESDRAAQVIGSVRLTQTQLQLIAPLLVDASPGQLRDLIRPFQRAVQQPAADQFLQAVEKSVSLLSLPEHELSDVIKKFPRESIVRGNVILDRLKQYHQQKMLRLQGLRDRLGGGDASRGKNLFTSEKAKCSTCHRVSKLGHAVGPDLTTIGSNRSANDLLESIVFPSASIVRDYATHQVLTVNGQAFSGILIAESNEAIELQQANGKSVRLLQSEIESVSPGSVSIMPEGLEGVLSEDELMDVVKYLQSLK